MINDIEQEYFQESVINPLKLPDEWQVSVVPGYKGYDYIFRNNGNEKVLSHLDEPKRLTERTTIGKEIISHIDPENYLSRDGRLVKFHNLMPDLQHKLELYVKQEEQRRYDEQLEEEQRIEEAKLEAAEVLQNLDNPLIYISSLIAWETAGERKNITLTFIVFCSHIIMKEAISVIGLGEGASGKTHLQEVAFKLIPKDYVVNLKNVTEAALFNIGFEDPYFFDGKIVNFGDLGGDKSGDFVIEAKNYIKELQSDGKLETRKNVPKEGGGWVSESLTLYGKPILTYTTIPNTQFDDQELSRSIIITPRMDNKGIFSRREYLLETGGQTWQDLKKYRQQVEQVQWMVEAIKDRMEKVRVYNPYHDNINNFLGGSRYVKRDLPKYNSILKVITAVNGHNRGTYNWNGKELLFTTKNDIKLFMDLMEPYHLSISENMSPKSSEVLNEFKTLEMNEYQLGSDRLEYGLTAADYFQKSNLDLAKRSCGNYLRELGNLGLMKTEKKGRENIYKVTGKMVLEPEDVYKLSKQMRRIITAELGEEVLEFVLEDELNKELTIDQWDEDVDKPKWE